MRIQDVSLAKQTRQRTTYIRMIEYLPDLGNARQDVVSRVTLLIENMVQLFAHAFVEVRSHIRANDGVSVHDELLNLPIRVLSYFLNLKIITI